MTFLVDDSDVGHNERLIAKALRGRRDGVIVATKGGHTRPGGAWDLDGRPEHIGAACEASLEALETDRIDLYQYHRPRPGRTVRRDDRRLQGAPGRKARSAGVGISNANVEQIELAGINRRCGRCAEPALARVNVSIEKGEVEH